MSRLLILVALLASCAKHRTVDLGFEENGANFGFLCELPGTTVKLASRAIVDRKFRACAYFDFIRLPSAPMCGADGIGDYCQTHVCEALPMPSIVPIPIEEDAPTEETSREFIVAVVRNLDGHELTDDGPEGPVLIRAVFERGACRPPPYKPHRDEDLIGCAQTCPLDLATTEGSQRFALPPLGASNCYLAVIGCANEGLPP